MTTDAYSTSVTFGVRGEEEEPDEDDENAPELIDISNLGIGLLFESACPVGVETGVIVSNSADNVLDIVAPFITSL